jgi:hypothetical protein
LRIFRLSGITQADGIHFGRELPVKQFLHPGIAVQASLDKVAFRYILVACVVHSVQKNFNLVDSQAT